MFSKENSGIFSPSEFGKYREPGEELWVLNNDLHQILCNQKKNGKVVLIQLSELEMDADESWHI